MPIHALKDPLGYAAMTALIQAGIYTAKAARNLTAAEAIEAAAGLGLIAGEVAPATAAAAAAAAGYTAYRGGKYAYKGAKDEINWLFGKKKKKKGTSSSQLPAQRMPKRPRDEYNDEVREQDREIRRRLGMGRPTGYNRIARKSSKFRKATKPIVDLGKYVSRNYDDYGTIEKNHTLWMCFQHHGSYGRLFDIIGESVAKAVLAKIKKYPRSYDEIISSADLDTALLFFRRVNIAGDDGADVTQVVAINGQTFKQIAGNFAYTMEEMATANGTVAPNVDTVARYLRQVNLYHGADATKGQIIIKDIGDSSVNVIVKQRIRMQNVTKNISDNLNTDQAGLNPLRGRKYVFANQRARVIDQVHADNTPRYDGFMHMQPSIIGPSGDVGDGINIIAGPLPKDDPISHPPPARQLFTNCKASAAIRISAGGMKVDSTRFSMSHKLKTLIERIYYAGFDKGSFGGVTWYGFEKAYRQAKPANAAADDLLSIGFNREVHMYAKCRLVTQKSMLKHYDASDLGLTGA